MKLTVTNADGKIVAKGEVASIGWESWRLRPPEEVSTELQLEITGKFRRHLERLHTLLTRKVMVPEHKPINIIYPHFYSHDAFAYNVRVIEACYHDVAAVTGLTLNQVRQQAMEYDGTVDQFRNEVFEGGELWLRLCRLADDDFMPDLRTGVIKSEKYRPYGG
jgi:hypothetical protein